MKETKPRYSRVSDILDLAIFMASRSDGITINDIQERYNVSRRTAERMRDSILNIFPSIDVIETNDTKKHWGFINYSISNFISFNDDELIIKDNDEFVFLGDYIDRGLYTKRVVDKLIELSKNNKCHFLLGNHEYFMLQGLNGNNHSMDFFLEYGGKETIKSYGKIENILKFHKNFYNNLKPYYLTDKYLFVHAGIRVDKSLEEQELFDMVMIRDNFIYNKHNLKQKVVFGHTPYKKPFIAEDKIGIDTGCGKYKDSPLTALICNKEEFVYSDNII